EALLEFAGNESGEYIVASPRGEANDDGYCPVRICCVSGRSERQSQGQGASRQSASPGIHVVSPIASLSLCEAENSSRYFEKHASSAPLVRLFTNQHDNHWAELQGTSVFRNQSGLLFVCSNCTVESESSRRKAGLKNCLQSMDLSCLQFEPGPALSPEISQ